MNLLIILVTQKTYGLVKNVDMSAWKCDLMQLSSH